MNPDELDTTPHAANELLEATRTGGLAMLRAALQQGTTLPRVAAIGIAGYPAEALPLWRAVAQTAYGMTTLLNPSGPLCVAIVPLHELVEAVARMEADGVPLHAWFSEAKRALATPDGFLLVVATREGAFQRVVELGSYAVPDPGPPAAAS